MGVMSSPLTGVTKPPLTSAMGVESVVEASLSFNFFSPTLPTGATFARNSVATDNVNSELINYAINAQRANSSLGTLLEDTRENSLPNSEATGAVVGVVGSGGSLPTGWEVVNTVGLTLEIVEAAIINGFSYITLKVSGTPSAGTFSLLFSATNNKAGVSGSRWSSSAYIGLWGGSLTNISNIGIRISGRNSAASYAETEGTTTTFTPTIDPTRRAALRLLNNAGTTHVVSQLDFTVAAAAVDATFLISSPQLENGYCTTSYIRTTSGAATRQEDILLLTAASIPQYSSSIGTIATSGSLPNGLAPNSQYLYCSEVGADSIYVFRNPATFQTKLWLFKSSSIVVDFDLGGTAAALSTIRAAIGYESNNVGFSVNNSAVSVDTSCPLMPGVVTFQIGRRGSGNSLNGYMKTWAYYPVRKTNAELKVLAA